MQKRESALKAEPATPRFSEIPVLLFIRGLALVMVVVAVVGLAHWYLGRRLIDPLPFSPLWHRVLWVVLVALFASIPGGFIFGRLLPRSLASAFQWIGFGWMGAFGLLLTAVGASDLLAGFVGLFTELGPSWMLWRAAVVLFVVGVALAIGFVVARLPRVKRVEVPIVGLPASLDGFRIVQLSDVHLGETLGRRFAEQVVAAANELKPDLIALTGDLVDGSTGRLGREVEPLADLRSRLGTFFVTGNHEFYHGAAAWEDHLSSLGITVLHNAHRVVQVGGASLVVAGMPDFEGGRFSRSHAPDPAATFRNAPPGVPRLLLAHQPRAARTVAHQQVSLMLSGHTHGGQMFPFMFLVRLQQPVVSGLHTIDGVLTYTSAGTGYWGPPFRLGPRGEITELTLRCAR